MPRVVVIGAGISGLTLAYRLQERLPGHDVIVLEANGRAGGTIDTLPRDGFLVEAGPNGFPDNNPSTFDLARQLGLETSLLPASEAAARNRFVLLDGHLRLLPNSFGSFLRSDLLSWIAKFHVFAERWRPARTTTADESIDAFVRRRVGGEIANTLADAFVTGILAGDPRLISMAAAFPKVAAWEREHGSLMRGMVAARKERRARECGDGLTRRAGTMWSFRGGLATLIRGLTEQLRHPPEVGVAVRRVRRDGRGWRVEADGRDGLQADAVVLACPAYRQAEIVADTDAALAERIGGIVYNRVAVVALGFRRVDVPHRLDGFGYLSPQRERRDVLGVQWCSSIYPERAPTDRVLVRALCGGWNRGEMLDWPDDRLLRAVQAELTRSLGILRPPLFHQIIRWHRAIPQYHLGHLDRVAWIEARLAAHPGLFVGGNAYRGVAINDCVEQAGLLAERVAAWANRPADVA
ncbi:MAG: protoporphyrinogen oxidase [Gemmataceae bacterium]